MKQTILGQIPSKSNCYRIITIHGHGSLAKTPALKAYEKSFYLQCNEYRNKGIKGLFELYVDVFNSSQRPDLDNSFKVLLDMLQSCGAIENDRNCIKIVAQKFVDKANPRVEFEIIEV
ncbi:RusA family crossover junction endodeoxyribonuclease [Petrimonas sulfuriphila]|uniref:RusA family crossover junction endodeoxyribonuclease n=1 Tax=Petrimonas sulfuriphila TaxID=285070 RepID=UPI003EBB4673